MKRYFLLTILFIFFLISCKEKENTEESTTLNTTSVVTPDIDSNSVKTNQVVTKDSNSVLLSYKDSIALLKLTENIFAQVKAKNYSAIAEYIDPVSGVRFSPYAYVDTINDVVFSKQVFLILTETKKQDTIVWGMYDAKQEPIRMTLDQYMNKFVYDVDFAKPEKKSVDKFLGGGNSLNNLLQVYKNCHFTESYFSGFEEKYQGHDWRSLRLVFKERNTKFYLVGIVHDQWTI